MDGDACAEASGNLKPCYSEKHENSLFSGFPWTWSEAEVVRRDSDEKSKRHSRAVERGPTAAEFEERLDSKAVWFGSAASLQVLIFIAMIVVAAIGVAGFIPWHELRYYTAGFVARAVFICILAPMVLFFLPPLFALTSGWKAARTRLVGPLWPLPIGLSLAAILLLSTLLFALLLIFAVMWYPLRIAASLVVLGMTLRVLFKIQSQQRSRIIWYGYAATAVILAAETLMVIMLSMPR